MREEPSCVPRLPQPQSPRRGVTLDRDARAVALLVLMMTVIVADLLGGHRRGLGAAGLPGARRQPPPARRDDPQRPARVSPPGSTPPLDPKDNLGYFEYGENSFADLQGEDTDDYLRFTAKAPEGQLFTGRVYLADRRQPSWRKPSGPNADPTTDLPADPADHGHQPVRRGDLLPPQRQPLSPRPAVAPERQSRSLADDYLNNTSGASFTRRHSTAAVDR